MSPEGLAGMFPYVSQSRPLLLGRDGSERIHHMRVAESKWESTICLENEDTLLGLLGFSSVSAFSSGMAR